MKNYSSHKKLENIKLEKISPKNITIKFTDEYTTFNKKNTMKNSLSKINKVLSHYKLMEIV